MGLYHKEMKGFLPLKSMFTFLFFSKSAVTVILPSNPMCGLHCCDDPLEGRRLTVVSGYCINTNKLELSHYSAFRDKEACWSSEFRSHGWDSDPDLSASMLTISS